MKFVQPLVKIMACTPACALSPSISFADCSGFVERVRHLVFHSNVIQKPGKFLDSIWSVKQVCAKIELRERQRKRLLVTQRQILFALWEDFVATDLISDLTNTIETTDSDGNTTGTAEEINAMVETMASNSSAVLVV